MKKRLIPFLVTLIIVSGLFSVVSQAALPDGFDIGEDVLTTGSVFDLGDLSNNSNRTKALNSDIFTFASPTSLKDLTNADVANLNTELSPSGRLYGLINSVSFARTPADDATDATGVTLTIKPNASIQRGVLNEEVTETWYISFNSGVPDSSAPLTITGYIPAKDEALRGFTTNNITVNNVTDSNFTLTSGKYIGYTNVSNYSMKIPVQPEWFALGSSDTITVDLLKEISVSAPTGSSFTATLVKNQTAPYILVEGSSSSALNGLNLTLSGKFPSSDGKTNVTPQTKTLSVPIEIREPTPATHEIVSIIGTPSTLYTGSAITFDLGEQIGSPLDLTKSNFTYSENPSTLSQNLNRLKVASNSNDFTAAIASYGSDSFRVTVKASSAAAAVGTGKNGKITLSLTGSTSVTMDISTNNLTFYDSADPEMLKGSSAAIKTSLTSDASLKAGETTFTITLTRDNFIWQGGSSGPSELKQKHLDTIGQKWLSILPEGYFDVADSKIVDGQIVLTIKGIKEMSRQTVKISVKDGSTTSVSNVAITAVTTTSNRITGIKTGSKLGISPSSVEIVDDKDYTGTSFSGMEVQPGDIIYIHFNSDFFNWSNGQPTPAAKVTTNMLTNATSKIAVNCTSKTVFETVELVNVDGNAVIKIKVNATLSSATAEKSFNSTVYFTVGGKRHTDSEINLSGVVAYKIQDVYGDYADMSDYPVIEPQESAKNAELYLGELDLEYGDSDTVEASIFTNLSSGKKVFAKLSEGTDSEHEKIQDSYPSVLRVLRLEYSGLSEAVTKVSFSGLGTMYIYDESGNYLGTTNDKVDLKKLYYLADKRINMSVGASVSESSTAPPPSQEAVPTSSTSGNYNPATGSTTGSRSPIGAICALAVCLMLGGGSLSLIRKRR